MKSASRRRSRRPAFFIAGAVLLAALLTWLLWPVDPYALPGGDWRLFKKRFLAPEGRIMDDENGGISHSEGQGYGMLLAVAFRDREAFDRIWTWTSKNLKRHDDYLFSWKWTPGADGKPGAVGDSNNATDGDLLIAWALLRAHREWGDLKYQQAAGQIVVAVLDRTTVPTYLGLQLLPGLAGFQSPHGVVLNPSYYVFPAFTELSAAFLSDKWQLLRDGGFMLLRTAQFGEWRLAPDWTLVADHWLALAPNHDPDFGYNAIRVPLNLAWDDPASPLLKPYIAFWESSPAVKWTPAVLNLDTGTYGPYAALPGMLAVRELALACAKKNNLTVTQIPRLTTEESYYSASLKLLVKVAIRERFGPKRN
ncbi:MAG: glycosyl hydrolase family 8 [Chthoniobacterales bacterium]